MKKTKKEIIELFGASEKDTGSSSVQIAILTNDILHLSDHMKSNKQDKHSMRGLMRKVSQRKKLQKFLKSDNPEEYKKVIAKLGLRS
ncbi:30S ribosomal protein S15 [Candidatus Nesciobacter abundans]|uniref:Small ribosomal subunit protein uS15 n=1 Tax=Candidatus Nesciobacter abundans TaxID=2601668 RepID=A0A5C0UFI8_9PROT|nr:30S ribosomal protein S15 [Candidatus Nesciobacter abundans]QEK38866.1 30S ribosomal protein S15 [Candidatus Nesciobacter abundans]